MARRSAPPRLRTDEGQARPSPPLDTSDNPGAELAKSEPRAQVLGSLAEAGRAVTHPLGRRSLWATGADDTRPGRGSHGREPLLPPPWESTPHSSGAAPKSLAITEPHRPIVQNWGV